MSEHSFVKSKFTYQTPEVCVLMFEDDSLSIKSYLGHFRYSVKLNGSNIGTEKLKAANNFLCNLHGSMAISSFSEATPKFVVGEINVPTMEIPVHAFSAYEFAAFMYYKTQAIIGDIADVVSFKFVAQAPIEVCVDLDTEALREDNPLIDEKSWVLAVNNIDEDGVEDITELDTHKPWWKRPTGELRDFFNHIDQLDEDQLGNLIAFNIDLGVDMEKIDEEYQKLEDDISLSKKIIAEYEESGEIPEELLGEIQRLADSLGFDLKEVMESISEGTLFDYDDDESTIRTTLVDKFREFDNANKGEDSSKSDSESTDDSPEKPKGPTIVRF